MAQTILRTIGRLVIFSAIGAGLAALVTIYPEAVKLGLLIGIMAGVAAMCITLERRART